MRKSILIEALFPLARRQILSTLLTVPEKEWYLSEIGRRHGTSPSSLQRELASLVAAGIVSRRRDGNRSYYRMDRTCPILEELRGVVLKTAGLVDPIRSVMNRFQKRVAVAFVFGSVASEIERGRSDVDLLVIGRVKLSEIVKVFGPVESEISRAVNPIVYTEEEFVDALESGQHFLTSVVAGKKLFIIGGDLELERLGSKRGGTRAPG